MRLTGQMSRRDEAQELMWDAMDFIASEVGLKTWYPFGVPVTLRLPCALVRTNMLRRATKRPWRYYRGL